MPTAKILTWRGKTGVMSGQSAIFSEMLRCGKEVRKALGLYALLKVTS